MSPVQTRRLPPDRPPHFLDYSVPPCRLLLLLLSTSCSFFFFFFFKFSLLVSFLLLQGVAPLLLSCQARPSWRFFFGPSSLLSRPVLSVQTAGSLRCSDPPVRCCLRRPTLTPCSFFLRTRKRLALLTPSRGLALAGLEKRPPGWAGHMGGREGGMGGGPALVR